jgi:alkylation response protein AidB-like acyl-CoA dehydrogenase
MPGGAQKVEGLEFLGALSDHEAAFRQELLDWLDEHLVGRFAELLGVGGPADDAQWEARVLWEKELATGGWRGISWPTELGGRGESMRCHLIFEYEYVRSRAPYRPSLQGESLFGPAMLRFGTDEQKQRFLSRILSADEYWCQGFSEPDAGSDLASLRTAARRDGDEWVINGQKVWTTFGHYSDWIYVLCRTDHDAPPHKGITCLLVKLDQPGVEMRPIRTLAGNADFNEVFFSDARTTADMVLGEVNGGWAVAMSMLGVERGTAMLTHQLAFEQEVTDLFATARQNGRAADPLVRQRLADAWIGMRLRRFATMQVVAKVVAGEPLGPEVSLSKLGAAVWHQDLTELHLDILGPAGAISGPGPEPTGPQRSFLLSRAETIYGGANEIQRNIIGERLLGLPR